jgi:predicted transcriptional regulator
MEKPEKLDLASRETTTEDAETLAAIEEGLRDVEAGRTVSAEEVRKRLPQWITASATRKQR